MGGRGAAGELGWSNDWKSLIISEFFEVIVPRLEARRVLPVHLSRKAAGKDGNSSKPVRFRHIGPQNDRFGSQERGKGIPMQGNVAAFR
jgi:hypothetical protein